MDHRRTALRSLLLSPFVVIAVVMVAAVAVGVVTRSPLAGTTRHVTPYTPTGHFAEGNSLVSGRLITPKGRRTTLGDFPVAIAASPDGRVAVIANSGQGDGAPQQGNESLQVVVLKTGKVVQTVADRQQGQATFYESGLAWNHAGTHLYATGGGNDQVYDYGYSGGRLHLLHRWKSSAQAGAPTVPGQGQQGGVPGTAPEVGDISGYSRGLAILPSGKAVIVTNEQGSTVAALSTTNGQLLWETTLGGLGQAGGGYPEAVVVSPNGLTAYVAAQGLNAVATIDTTTGLNRGLTPVGDHPVALALGEHGSLLFVTNANDDSLSVLKTGGVLPTVARSISIHLVNNEANGSTPDAVTVDDRTHTVYVANAGDNVVRILTNGRPGHHARGPIDPAKLNPNGVIPAGWYPSALAFANHKLLVTSAKGLGSTPITNRKQYDVNRRHGLLTTVIPPTKAQVETWRRMGVHNLIYPSLENRLRPRNSPIPTLANKGHSPIKHVVLIVRENRTFDQVFGDLKRKGAHVKAAYEEFPAKNAKGQTVTPNIHRLADQFALSQNFYSDGEASIQGHNWTAEGVSTDYTERSYLHYYSARNHPYDPTAAIVYPKCGAIFQQLARQGKTFRNFGELVGLSTSQTPTTKNAPHSRCGEPSATYDPQSVANFDSNLGANLSLTAVSDVDKVQEITSVLKPLVAANRLPQFSYAVLGNDHTDGTSAGKKTPSAHVATNDYAVGKLIDYLSHTKDWKSTAVFVEEDDSQDGLDHVDGHRNILMVASPYANPHALSNLHISQASVLHTIELILGMQPLSSYTQYAPVPYDMFAAAPHLKPYSAVRPTYPLTAKNGAARTGSAAAVPLDLSHFDVAGPVLEAQIWQSTHPTQAMPGSLLQEIWARGGIERDALTAWRDGRDCLCRPLMAGLSVAPGSADWDG